MFKNKKIIMLFLNVVFFAMPFSALAGYTLPRNTGLPMGELADGSIIINIMNWMLALVGVIGIIGFVISGVLYFISAGDDTKMGTAKNAMTYSIIGVIVALVGFIVIQAVDAMLDGFDIF